jgi:hypothetical protein
VVVVYSIHIYKQTVHNTENGTCITIKKIGTYITMQQFFNYFGKRGPCPVFASYTLTFALQVRKKHEKTSLVLRPEVVGDGVSSTLQRE